MQIVKYSNLQPWKMLIRLPTRFPSSGLIHSAFYPETDSNKSYLSHTKSYFLLFFSIKFELILCLCRYLIAENHEGKLFKSLINLKIVKSRENKWKPTFIMIFPRSWLGVGIEPSLLTNSVQSISKHNKNKISLEWSWSNETIIEIEM